MLNATLATKMMTEFDTRHGPRVQINGMWYYADGAMREAGGPLMCCLREPPTDPAQRQRNIIAYHEAMVGNAREAAEVWRDRLEQSLAIAKKRPNDPCAPPPTDGDLAKLEQLVAALRKCEAGLVQARGKAVAENQPAKTRQGGGFDPQASRLAKIETTETRLRALRF